MQDPFTGQPTCIRGRTLPGPAERAALQHDHERRLAALARLGAAAAECGIHSDTDRDLVVLPEDDVSLLEAAARPFLVADLHARNFVRDRDGALRLIDLVAAPWPEAAGDAAISGWLARVREDTAAPALPGAPDGEL